MCSHYVSTNPLHSSNFFFTGYSCTHRYHSSPTRLQCVTQPYPGAQDGFSYGPLQTSLLTDSMLTTSAVRHYNQFTYRWENTPQVCVYSVWLQLLHIFGTLHRSETFFPGLDQFHHWLSWVAIVYLEAMVIIRQSFWESTYVRHGTGRLTTTGGLHGEMGCVIKSVGALRKELGPGMGAWHWQGLTLAWHGTTVRLFILYTIGPWQCMNCFQVRLHKVKQLPLVILLTVHKT